MIKVEDLRFGSKAHRKISEAVWARLRLSEQTMSKRYARWAENEELFSAYMPAREVDELRKQKKKSSGIVDYVTIEVPYIYAIALTAHTYYTSVFLGRNPAFQFEGRHGEPETKKLAVEAIIDYQMQVGANLLPLYIWLLDPLKYGLGFVGHYWDEERIALTKKVDVQPTFGGVPIPFSTPKTEYVTETTIGYAGNKLYNVRPQDAFPDPRVPMWNFQAGEFFARYVEIPIAELRNGEANGKYFNVKAALDVQKNGGSYAGMEINRDEGSSRVTELPETNDEFTIPSTPDDQPIGVLKGYEFYWRIVPSQWGVSESREQEIWVVTQSKERIVIGFEPLGDASNRFPFDIIEHEPNGYAFSSRSMMEIGKPLNDIMSWLFNSHFYNVRAALNNMFVVDPSLLHMTDLERPGPGKMMRLTPAGYGRGVETVIKQFPVADVTRSNVQDIQGVSELIQRIFGVTDNVMGLVNPGGRKTATEVRTSTSLAANRLKTQCEIMSAMGFSPMAQKLVQRTQSRLTIDRKYRIVGDLMNFGDPFIQADAASIAGFFDYVPVDGTMPIDRYAQAALWQGIMTQAAQVPQIGMQYDFGKIFAWVATLAGAKNIQQFRLNIQVSDADKLMAGAQSGNVIPLRDAPVEGATPQPAQHMGMGQPG